MRYQGNILGPHAEPALRVRGSKPLQIVASHVGRVFGAWSRVGTQGKAISHFSCPLTRVELQQDPWSISS